MTKSETLAHWAAMAPDAPIMPHFEAIPYKAEGSKYGACGIRIDGSPAFVDAVLSRLKDLLAGENHVTRLELSRQELKSDFKKLPNSVLGAECCYIRLHRRGRQGAMASAIFDRHLDGATETYLKQGA